MSDETAARAVVLLRDDGQVLCHSSSSGASDRARLGSLVVALAAQGKPGLLGTAMDRFSCEAGDASVYGASVSPGTWLVSLQEQTLNPGLLRRQTKQYAEAISRALPTGATLSPAMAPGASPLEKITQDKTAIFTDLTDDEIDRLFEDALG